MKTVHCVVESPKGSSGKFDFEPATGRIKLRKALPAGLVFPFDFGYIEGTLGEDGDPLDVIIISEIATFPGCAMDCRIIGAINAAQTEQDGVTERNDRFIAIPDVSVMYAKIQTLSQLERQTLQEIERFFINYNDQAGKRFKPLKHTGQKAAQSILQQGFDNASPTHLVQLFLPRQDAAGAAFPGRHYTIVQKTLADKFGGVTIYSQAPATGLWKNDESNLEKDQLVIFEVMVSEIDPAFWKSYKKRLEKMFSQDQILIRRSDVGLF